MWSVPRLHSKIQVKVNTRRKIQMKGNSDRMKVRYDCLAGRVTKCGSII
jgi:hypothetical protein